MQRIFELFRKILMVTKEYNNKGLPIPIEAFDDIPANKIIHNIELMLEADLIRENGDRLYSDDKLDYIQLTLSNAGHDYLKTSKNKNAWNNLINYFVDKGIELTAKTLAEYMHLYMKQ